MIDVRFAVAEDLWYHRLGYRPVRVERLGDRHPELEPLLATPCDLLVYHKGLRA